MNKFFITIIIFLNILSCVSASEVKFAQISDIHFRSDIDFDNDVWLMYPYAQDLLYEVISKINNDRTIQFSIVTGDIIDNKLSDALKVITELNQLNKNWYYVLGNHDVGFEGSKKNDYKNMFNVSNPNGFGKDKTFYVFKPKKDIVFIALDTVDDREPLIVGKISDEQLIFLDNTLKNTKKDNVAVIFCHHNLKNIVNKNEFEKVLNKYKIPIIFLSGHAHNLEITQKQNFINVVSPALISYPNAFRIITINNSASRTVIDFDYSETDMKNIQQLAKIRFIQTFGQGNEKFQEKDKKCTIIIEKRRNKFIRICHWIYKKIKNFLCKFEV